MKRTELLRHLRSQKKMEPFAFISKYFWLLAIAFTGINLLIFKRRSRKHIKENPIVEKGYSVLFRGYLFWMNIPWLIMGIGIAFGGVPSVWHYFRPGDRNPYVLVWYGAVFALWIIGTVWLFFKGGAEMIAQHPGALEFSYGLKRKEITNPKAIKVLWVMVLAGALCGVACLWFMEIPIPNVR
jgi:hypothetical protein